MSAGGRILVIFDLDDTLIESRKAFEVCENQFFSRYGLTYTPEERKEKFIGVSMQVSLKHLRDDFRRVNGADAPPDFENEILAMYDEVIENGFEMTSGAAELLDWLKQESVPHVIASNSRKTALPRKIATSGLTPWFNFHAHTGQRNAFSADEVAAGKPAPDLFWHTAREMGGFAPHECIVVEDSAPGIQAGRAAGMFVVGFTGSYGRGEDEPAIILAAEADIALKDLRLVKDIVAQRRLLPPPPPIAASQ